MTTDTTCIKSYINDFLNSDGSINYILQNHKHVIENRLTRLDDILNFEERVLNITLLGIIYHTAKLAAIECKVEPNNDGFNYMERVAALNMSLFSFNSPNMYELSLEEQKICIDSMIDAVLEWYEADLEAFYWYEVDHEKSNISAKN